MGIIQYYEHQRSRISISNYIQRPSNKLSINNIYYGNRTLLKEYIKSPAFLIKMFKKAGVFAGDFFNT